MFYTIKADGIKLHLCDSWILTQQVLNNLFSRFPDKKFLVSSQKTSDFRFDLLGSLARSNMVWGFPVADMDFKVHCYAQHWPIFADAVLTATSDKYDGQFYKLHGWGSVLCLSHANYSYLKKYVETNYDDFENRYNTEFRLP